MFKKVDKEKTTSAERTGKRAMWGDNGAARIPSQAYKDNWEKIFGNKDKKKDEKTV